MAKLDQSFWKEALQHAFRKDIPILLYLVYLWFGVLDVGMTRIYQITSSDVVSTSIILAVIILPAIPVIMRVWYTR
ncbi:hypothetical protein HYV86_03425 [Candidatus Woesearchaeota archaeon]|nr:hypothetical protein [Candidatus Woesearchaeota archaeon]